MFLYSTGLPLGGSANAVLSLNCNTSHLACHLNLENTEYFADSYTYYVGVVCNGTQVGVGITKLEWKSGCNIYGKGI